MNRRLVISVMGLLVVAAAAATGTAREPERLGRSGPVQGYQPVQHGNPVQRSRRFGEPRRDTPARYDAASPDPRDASIETAAYEVPESEDPQLLQDAGSMAGSGVDWNDPYTYIAGPSYPCTYGKSCNHHGRGHRGIWWGRAEYLSWWVDGQPLPPLVTTSPVGTAQTDAGVLPDATVRFGSDSVDDERRAGGRFTIGYWSDESATCGYEANYFSLEELNTNFSATSDGIPILARPFFNVLTDAEDAALVAFPSIVDGTIRIGTYSEIEGMELLTRRAVLRNRCWSVDYLAGYRYLRLDEGLTITEGTTSTATGGPVPVGTQIDIVDRFDTENRFHGATFGMAAEYHRSCWSFELLAKLGIGAVHQTVNINGSTAVTTPGDPTVTSVGGLLALDSNIGRRSQNEFSVVPELGARFEWQANELWRLSAGYSMIFATNVLRPGDQIDRRLDPNQFPPGQPGTFPVARSNDSTLWVQGISIGAEARF